MQKFVRNMVQFNSKKLIKRLIFKRMQFMVISTEPTFFNKQNNEKKKVIVSLLVSQILFAKSEHCVNTPSRQNSL